jgi:ornithine--oxo-acid transaminase
MVGNSPFDRFFFKNSGAEANEAAIKIARKWGREVRGVSSPKIVVAEGNFHGRTTTIVSFSTDRSARDGFGPFTPGFTIVPFGDAQSLADAVDDDTVAVLLEPIQGEAGVIIPPPGYLAAVRRVCTERNALFIADEIQSGLARTGRTFACEHEDVVPDIYVVGKALGGGVVPVSAVLSSRRVLEVIRPGNHGSTFGGNPLAAAVGQAVVGLLQTGQYQERAQVLGRQLGQALQGLPGISAVRIRGLWAGVDVDPHLISGRQACERLMDRGVLAKETHGSTIRLAPPLVVGEAELEWMVEQLAAVLARAALRPAVDDA